MKEATNEPTYGIWNTAFLIPLMYAQKYLSQQLKQKFPFNQVFRSRTERPPYCLMKSLCWTISIYELKIKELLANPHSPSTIPRDRKSTRLNSSHVRISYAVFCL